MRKLALVALVTALGAGVSTSALAAGQQTAQPQAQTQAQNVKVSDKELSLFVEAEKSVNSIRQSAISKLGQTKDQNAAQKIQQQANESMVKAVKDTGLSVQDYNKIARALQTDKDLRSRISQLQKAG
ncbi:MULTISPECIES: DUF4168 domain-containing protein [Vibrio]|uniref:DUF4168 domain-containing protein n=2 Tax=Vibrio TaxID=662 RepID=A0A7X4LPT6_9VIBR|nr:MULTISPECIES: DUF4168 domain-containing protein [Vibrio]MBF9000226.1 DUF4168 domain-containing protein [Vibrio nitrifigilis]MZI95909.1 DUF4168 domain-containing protein [Vibrio eleionomae]